MAASLSANAVDLGALRHWVAAKCTRTIIANTRAVPVRDSSGFLALDTRRTTRQPSRSAARPVRRSPSRLTSSHRPIIGAPTVSMFSVTFHGSDDEHRIALQHNATRTGNDACSRGASSISSHLGSGGTPSQDAVGARLGIWQSMGRVGSCFERDAVNQSVDTRFIRQGVMGAGPGGAQSNHDHDSSSVERHSTGGPDE